MQFLNSFNHAQNLPGAISDAIPLGYTGTACSRCDPGLQNFTSRRTCSRTIPRQMVLVLAYTLR